MKKSEQLFYLIKSLTKSEKRSFKLFAKMNGGEKNYTILFDALDKMTVYDHDLLVKSMQKKTNVKNVSQLKKQLENIIKRSLLQHSSVSTYGIEIHTNINYATILMQKGLFAQAKEVMVKTEKMALECEDHLAIDRLSILEYEVALKETDRIQIETYLENTYPRVEDARLNNKQEADFEVELLRIRSFYLKNNSLRGVVNHEELEELVKSDLLSNDPSELSLGSQLIFHAIWGHYYYMKWNAEKTYYHFKWVVDEMKEGHGYPWSTWWIHARMLLISLYAFKMKGEFQLELEAIKRKQQEMKDENRGGYSTLLLELTLSNIQLDSEIQKGNFSRAERLIPGIRMQMEEAKVFIDTNLKMTLQSNFVTVNIGLGNYKNALVELNSIMNTPDMAHIRINTQCYNRIKNIAIHYSLGNYELLSYLVRSSEHFFQKSECLNDYVKTFLKFARKHLGEAYSQSKQEVFEEHIEDLAKVRRQLPENVRPHEYFNIEHWLKSLTVG